MFKAFNLQSLYLEIHDEADTEHYPEAMMMVETYTPDKNKLF